MPVVCVCQCVSVSVGPAPVRARRGRVGAARGQSDGGGRAASHAADACAGALSARVSRARCHAHLADQLGRVAAAAGVRLAGDPAVAALRPGAAADLPVPAAGLSAAVTARRRC